MNFVSIRDVNPCNMTKWEPFYGRIKNIEGVAEFVLWNQNLGEYKFANTTNETDDDRDSYDMYS